MFLKDFITQRTSQPYEPLIPPGNKPIDTLTAAETQQFFDWYVQHIPGESGILPSSADFRRTRTARPMRGIRSICGKSGSGFCALPSFSKTR